MNKCFFCYQPTHSGKNYHSLCCKKFFGTKNLPELSLDKSKLKTLAQQNISKRVVIPGVQSKLSLDLEKHTTKNHRLTVVGLWGNYILKPQYEPYPYMPQVEDLTMHLASLFKIPVCKHSLLQSKEGELVYLVRRFDRKKGEKIHVEDFCQLSGFLTEQKYKSSYEKIGSLILKYCTYKGLDALNFFELLLFSFLCGNNDMHLKNFSIIHNNGVIELSPAYDLLNVSLVYPSDKEELGLYLNGKKNNICINDFEALALRLKISSKVQEKIYKKYKQGQEKVIELVKKSFLPLDYQKKYLEIWDKRAKAIF